MDRDCPAFYEDMAGEFMLGTTQWQEHHRLTEELEFRSCISVPLTARGRILGALTPIATARPRRRHGRDDFAWVPNLGRRAGLALDNSRLYQETDLQKMGPTAPSAAAIEGVLVVSLDGAIASFNRRLVEMWGSPEGIPESRDTDVLLAEVLATVVHPEVLSNRLRKLRNHRMTRGPPVLLPVFARSQRECPAPL